MDSSCDVGSTYPVLATSPVGTSSLDITCGDTYQTSSGARMYRYFFKDPQVIDHMVRQGGVLGIAFALQSGRFAVMRFDNEEAGENLDSMLRIANARDVLPRAILRRALVKCNDGSEGCPATGS